MFAAVEKTPVVQDLLRRLESGASLSCAGVSRGAQPFLAVLLRRLFPKRPVLVISDGLKTQELYHQDLETWLGTQPKSASAVSTEAPKVDARPSLEKEPAKKRKPKPTASGEPAAQIPLAQLPSTPRSACYFYPAWEILPHESKLPHVDVISERLETLVALGNSNDANGAAPIINSQVTALLQKTFAQADLKSRTRTVQKGERIEPLDFVEWLEEQGYEPEAQVNHKGEIALRGGILDIFPPTSPWPVRLEFFGDELESLRYFDPVSQISREEIGGISICPAGELAILQKARSSAGASNTSVSPNLATLLDYLPAQTLVILCEPEHLNQQARNYHEMIPKNDPFYVPWPDILSQMRAQGMSIIQLHENELIDPSESTEHFLFPFQNLEAFRPLLERAADPQVVEAQRKEFFAQLHRWSRQSFEVQVFCNNNGERQRFDEVWKEYGYEAASGEKLFTHLGSLSRGFICDQAHLVVVTDAEIFGRYKFQRPRRLKSPHAPTSRSLLDIDFTDLDDGDYVVHLQHGIGRYLGLGVLPGSDQTAAGEGQECLIIEYAPPDEEQPTPKLYVPVTEAHLVSKYVGAGKARPPLNTLGGGRWAKTKEQARQAVRDLASELLSIQAARETNVGHAFPTDNTWQREFESSFLFEETPDQMKAILDAKADMEGAKPMDRLICGDVGYGKTEVAIRATFKAVMGGKQAAILVPTTVLAQQHYNTFRERMADYPIRIEMLSRFRTARQQSRIVRDLAAGAVDVVIGTHRLVQGDIVFKDLGLVVIDEEQRFGVMHKEKFKLMRKLVDVLTLSATPIPRTLYLALTGARDMSTIETPPQDRLPVETIVTQYDERVIRDAIIREMNREGQVFYLHNRVLDIEAVALRLRTLVPKAKILVGHGQMGTDELEDVMAKFVNGEADVLLSTTIIESGLDIPNANTIIIDRADRFGLSDLYQLRGRVGRYKHQAYAYLLLPRHAGLLTDARKRISAIKQYSSLGSGFKIAMRDLEIRGAGNLLGPQQSGHITAVGFELYCQLLKQSVSSLKGERVKPRVEVQLRMDFLSLNPAEEGSNAKPDKQSRRKSKAQNSVSINLPRDTAAYVAGDPESSIPVVEVEKAFAYLPMNYIAEAHQRIEIYRKLAELVDMVAVERLRTELRDRFGPLPPPVELLLQAAALKILASNRGITVIETRDDKLMLTRNNDYVTLQGKFPRLTKPKAADRLKEIKKLILAYPEQLA